MIEVKEIDENEFKFSLQLNSGTYKLTELAAKELYKKLGEKLKEKEQANDVSLHL